MYNAVKLKLPSVKKIKSLFVYLNTGHLYCKKTHKIVGYSNTNGYVQVIIDGRKYLAHRIIYKMWTGNDPDYVNHMNFNIKDNRIENLESVTSSENSYHRKGPNKNNKLGIRNLFYNKNRKKFIVVIRGVFYGEFRSIESALKKINEIRSQTTK